HVRNGVSSQHVSGPSGDQRVPLRWHAAGNGRAMSPFRIRCSDSPQWPIPGGAAHAAAGSTSSQNTLRNHERGYMKKQLIAVVAPTLLAAVMLPAASAHAADRAWTCED